MSVWYTGIPIRVRGSVQYISCPLGVSPTRTRPPLLSTAALPSPWLNLSVIRNWHFCPGLPGLRPVGSPSADVTTKKANELTLSLDLFSFSLSLSVVLHQCCILNVPLRD